MNTRSKRSVKHLVVALLLAGGLGGCVYDPYYSGYAYPAYSYPSYSYYGYPGYYAYPTYVGPPVSLSFGFYKHHGGHHHGGYHGGHHGGGGHHRGGRH